jgi:adenosine 3'-phospho 5'-phosphosulfate transporter B3
MVATRRSVGAKLSSPLRSPASSKRGQTARSKSPAIKKRSTTSKPTAAAAAAAAAAVTNTAAAAAASTAAADVTNTQPSILPLALGVIACHTISSYFHEAIFQLECADCSKGKFEFGLFLTLVEYTCYTCFALAELVHAGKPPSLSRALSRDYVMLAVAHIGAHGMTNMALTHINFAAKVIFKSCKVLPVMLGGFLLLGNRYQRTELAAGVAMTGGLIVFNYADISGSPTYDYAGLVFCTLSLVSESFVGNLQQRVLHRGGSKETLAFFQFLNAGALTLLICLLNGEAQAGTRYILGAEPALRNKAAGSILAFAVFLYAGLKVIFELLRTRGAIAVVTVTSLRRMLTLVGSYLLFPGKSFNAWHFVGLCAVTGSATVMSMHKARQSGGAEKRGDGGGEGEAAAVSKSEIKPRSIALEAWAAVRMRVL